MLMWRLVFGYATVVDRALLFYVLNPLTRMALAGHSTMVVMMHIPLAIFAYWWAKKDKAMHNGFYFDGLPVYKKLLIVLVLTMPTFFGIAFLASATVAKVMPSFLIIPLLMPVLIFTYWWIQQGNPAQNKYDQAKTSRIKKLLVAGLPLAAALYTAALLLYIVLVRN